MSARPILETRGLTMRFGGVAAVDEADFTLEDGELRCLIGPNGAGKSTFFKCLSGQIAPTSGRVFFAGEDITGAEPHYVARLGVGIKTQVPSVFDGLTVRENLMLSARRRLGRAAAARLADETMGRVGLAVHGGRRVGHLAHGQRQWLELGLVVANDPRLVLLDEPTAGMTHDEVAKTAELIREIGATRSRIVVEHVLQFIRMIAHRVTVFHQGRILVEDTMEKIMADARVRNIYLGKQAVAGDRA